LKALAIEEDVLVLLKVLEKEQGVAVYRAASTYVEVMVPQLLRTSSSSMVQNLDLVELLK
jgi:hypothetical protein